MRPFVLPVAMALALLTGLGGYAWLDSKQSDARATAPSQAPAQAAEIGRAHV